MEVNRMNCISQERLPYAVVTSSPKSSEALPTKISHSTTHPSWSAAGFVHHSLSGVGNIASNHTEGKRAEHHLALASKWFNLDMILGISHSHSKIHWLKWFTRSHPTTPKTIYGQLEISGKPAPMAITVSQEELLGDSNGNQWPIEDKHTNVKDVCQ